MFPKKVRVMSRNGPAEGKVEGSAIVDTVPISPATQFSPGHFLYPSLECKTGSGF
jgi:hypothetical protein